MANLPPCLIGMEACGGAHHWARAFRQLGHDVRIINPQYVKPYVKSQKNDYNDAEAICEAVRRPNMRFVPVKSVEQQDIQALHRIGIIGLAGAGSRVDHRSGRFLYPERPQQSGLIARGTNSEQPHILQQSSDLSVEDDE